MSLARQHRDRILAQQTASAPALGSGLAAISTVAATAADRAAAQIQMRLAHDLRRLKEIASIERKIDAKREMIPEYVPWVSGLLNVARETGQAVADDILPTIMVWLIDTGDWSSAIELAAHVLQYDVPLPARYVRSAPALIAEEIALAALKAQTAGDPFPIDVLERVEALTSAADMHDEIRAKLQKAIGLELARRAEYDPADPNFIANATRALVPLRRAQQLQERIGVKEKIKRLEKAIEVASKPQA